jgi:hypothetical protein
LFGRWVSGVISICSLSEYPKPQGIAGSGIDDPRPGAARHEFLQAEFRLEEHVSADDTGLDHVVGNLMTFDGRTRRDYCMDCWASRVH